VIALVALGLPLAGYAGTAHRAALAGAVVGSVEHVFLATRSAVTVARNTTMLPRYP
jgi:hypothetical protein